jgi:tetratricopeptide (TPR) repeat protein
VRASALANLARLALGEGELATAERRLAEAKRGVKEPRGTERIAWLELEARIHLARGRLSVALRAVDEALALARASLLKLQEWSLLVARGEVLDALGKTRDAIDALRAAEDALDDATLLVPLGEGRGAFAGGRSRSARVLLALLVKTRQLREASATGRRAHGRVLSSVERGLRLEQLAPRERAKWEDAIRAWRTARAAIDAEAAGDWKLPADALARASRARMDRERELRSALESALSVLARASNDRVVRNKPEPDEPGVLEIDIYPDVRGFVVLANEANAGSSSHRVPTPRGASSDELARALFEPIQERMARSTLVRVRAWGAWRAVDVHALPWRGAPLIEHVPVEYSLGLGDPIRAAAGHVVVVGDPTGDLPGALAEARAVAATLEGRKKPLRVLVRDDATSRAVTDHLRGAEQLHYAGHGVFAGEEGWESALPLAAGGRLTIGDILALAPAPGSVVLTGCEAARSVGEAEGLGLAQAFIVAGSSDVVAPVRRVPDALAETVAVKLHESLGPELVGQPRLAPPMRRAVLAVRKGDPSSDWAAFRVLVP